MEKFYWYKGYGIRYLQVTGTTLVEDNGFVLIRLTALGEMDGDKEAKEFIDCVVAFGLADALGYLILGSSDDTALGLIH